MDGLLTVDFLLVLYKEDNMSNLFVKNLPSIQEREFKYRSQMSSHELNQQQKEVFADILDLFNKANELQKTVYEMNQVNGIESACYSKRLREALLNLEKVNERYQNLVATENEYRYITKYAYDAIVNDDTYGAVVDRNTNDIIAHIINSTSKTRLYDETYDESLTPPSLTAYIGPDDFKDHEGILSVEDSDINNAFDGRSDTVWFRKVITTTDVDYIENELVIGLPEDIITTRLMNQITILPFPIGYVDIMDVLFKANGAWQQITGFESHHGITNQQKTDIFGNVSYYKAINDSSGLKFTFPNTQTNQLKIKMRQRNYEYDAENNRRIFYLGIRDVDVVYNIYARDHSVFDMVFEFPETDRNIKIYNTEILYNNSDSRSAEVFGITKEYFYYDEEGNTHKIASSCPFVLDGHRMMVRYTIDVGQTTPNIYACNVKYKLA